MRRFKKKNQQITISDNGVGFDDYGFGKISKLFDVEDNHTKVLED